MHHPASFADDLWHLSEQEGDDRSIAHEGRWLVSAAIQNDAEDADARNLMVTAGAAEISSVADGSMVMIARPGEEGAGSQG